MTNWDKPVKEIGDIVVLGERHRKRSSRRLFNEAWDKHDFEAVCVEAPPDGGIRDDGGGAVGGALVSAEQEGITRYYVDNPTDESSKRLAGVYGHTTT